MFNIIRTLKKSNRTIKFSDYAPTDRVYTQTELTAIYGVIIADLGKRHNRKVFC